MFPRRNPPRQLRRPRNARGSSARQPSPIDRQRVIELEHSSSDRRIAHKNIKSPQCQEVRSIGISYIQLRKDDAQIDWDQFLGGGGGRGCDNHANIDDEVMPSKVSGGRRSTSPVILRYPPRDIHPDSNPLAAPCNHHPPRAKAVTTTPGTTPTQRKGSARGPPVGRHGAVVAAARHPSRS
jgi:hypothetical protein